MGTPLRWHQSLTARLGVVFVLFVITGSSLLLVWLRRQQQQEAKTVFTTLAHTDADFVRRLNLPRSAKLAGNLQQLLGMHVHFRDSAGHLEPPLPAPLAPALAQAAPREEVYPLTGQQEALVLPLDERHDMILIRSTATPALSLLHPATRNALLAFWVLSAGLAWVIGGQVLGPLGSLTRRLPGFFSHTGAPPPEANRRDEIGQLARTLTQARDELVEERQKREQSERLALLGRLATGLAHEIKNPLASIQLHADLIPAPAHDPESMKSLQHIRDEGRVIEGLVNQWLYLARPASPQRVRIDLRDCLAQTLQSLAGQAEHAGVAIDQAGVPDQPIQLLGDRSRLQQAFRNVVINAIQAMPGGGKLHVTVDPLDSGVRVTFEDTGPGFSAAALARGTDLFFSEKEGGMGVGLNVVAEIISAHSGNMTLKNRPNGGAVVELLLPREESRTHNPMPS